MASKRLYRSKTDRMLAGIAGGLGDYFDIDPIVFRLALVLLTLFGGTGIVIYLIAWVIIPEEGSNSAANAKAVGKEIENRVHSVANEVKEAFSREETRTRPHSIGGLVLIALGIIFLIQNLIGFDVWQVFWPVVIIALGLGILMHSKKDNS
jgi:phage shock protein C